MRAEEILAHGGMPTDTRVFDQTDRSIFWKECATCTGIYPHSMFKKDASYREGYRDQCLQCEAAPRLSTNEHTARLRELNYYSAGVKGQRGEHPEELVDSVAREGRRMHHSEVLSHLRKMVPSLFVTDGRIAGDLAFFRTFGQPQPHLDGRTFQYLFYMPTGWMPEYSIHEFDHRDIPVKELQRGWRTILLRLIRTGLITEAQCDKAFGRPSGEASTRWRRTLFVYRNGHE